MIGTGRRVVTVEQAAAATALVQGRVAAGQARALAQLEVEQARARARRAEQVAERAARAAAVQDRAARRDAVAAQRRERRAAARERRRAAWTERRALVSVLPIMGASAAVALPAQLQAFEALTGSAWSAAAIAAMVEGGTWAGAAMESIAVRRSQPTGAYVALTWGCASVACAMNVAHGLWPSDGAAGDWQLALAYGLASLLGPIAWAVYSRLQRHIVAGRTGEQALLAAVRRARYPIESWRALSLRAAQGPEVSTEDAWTQVWAARQARRATRAGAGRRGKATQADVDQAVLDDAQLEDQVVLENGVEGVAAGGSPDEDGLDEDGLDLDGEDQDAVPVPAPRPAPRAAAPRSPRSPRESSAGSSARAGRRPAVTGRRSLEELREQLVEAVRAGRLPTTPSADAIRHELACSPSRARTLRDERHALTEQVAGQLDLDEPVVVEAADEPVVESERAA